MIWDIISHWFHQMFDIIKVSLKFIYYYSPVISSILHFIYEHYDALVIGMIVSTAISSFFFFMQFNDKSRRNKIIRRIIIFVILLLFILMLWLNPNGGSYYQLYIECKQNRDYVIEINNKCKIVEKRLEKMEEMLEGYVEQIDNVSKMLEKHDYEEYHILYNNLIQGYTELQSNYEYVSGEHDRLEAERLERLNQLGLIIDES